MYFRAHLPWFILFIVFNLSILLLGMLDAAIPNLSVLYIALFNSIILIIFVIWDYFRSRSYMRELMHLERLEEVDGLPRPRTAYQKGVHDRLMIMKQRHNADIETESKKTKENLDEMTRWIHDLKMPMTTMKLLVDDLESGDRRKMANEWQRLDGMLNEMLYQKRLSNIGNDLYFEQADLEMVVGRTLQKLRTLCMEKGIGFDVDLHVAHVESDVKWLSFILDQIVTNSVKYTGNDEIGITSTFEEGRVVLEVSDHGRGIRAEDLPRIFEAGFTSTSDHGDRQSTGMGLYLARQAAEAMGIKIGVDSEYGRGTMVTLTFPQKNAYHQVKTM